jgi:aspartyl-tRNA(Asn)/glutamyl-tRNA(Gln) amidotransferase subunit B
MGHVAPFEAVIGLEIHAQLLSRTKIFCGCSTAFGAPPNTQVCPVCLGLPGALPTLNRRAVEMAIMAALALDCTIHDESIFARKNYLYPDLPKGYQISQYDRPLATGGGVDLPGAAGPVHVRLTRIHLEEDAGKSLHHGFADSDRATYLDFNRSGVPLIEIVTEPDLRSAADAAACFARLRQTLVALGVTDGNMEEGSLRCDANVSLREVGQTRLGTKTEVKNVNSFRYLQKALEYEIERQTAILAGGGRVVQETRLWNTEMGQTASMRGKEEAHDYRYFPEPDLAPVRVARAWIDELAARLPELPEARKARLMSRYGLAEYDADLIVRLAGAADYFEAMVAAGASARGASNWLQGEVRRKLKDAGAEAMSAVPMPPPALAELVVLAESGRISSSVAKQVFETMWTSGRAAGAIVEAEGLAQLGDEAALGAWIDEVLAQHGDVVAQYRNGRTSALGFLVGQVMKRSRGKADPKAVSRLLEQRVNDV